MSEKKEKLLVCDALDERDFLRKKINTAIDKLSVVGARRKKDDKVAGISVEEFNKRALSEYQSIKDLIKRYEALDSAITLANANTTIELRSGKTMTRAAAISLRKSIKNTNSLGTDFNARLVKVLGVQFANALREVEMYNRKADTELESYKTGFIGRDDKKLSDENIEMISKLVADLYGQLEDPIGLKDELDKLTEEQATVIKEIETAIKISNATTYVELD